jgi:hypothetical protein
MYCSLKSVNNYKVTVWNFLPLLHVTHLNWYTNVRVNKIEVRDLGRDDRDILLPQKEQLGDPGP